MTYPSIESMHPQIRAFFENQGKLKLDDEETPTICFLISNNGVPEHSIAISVAELRWLGAEQYKVCEDRPGNEWLYYGPDGWCPEDEMLRLIKLAGFW